METMRYCITFEGTYSIDPADYASVDPDAMAAEDSQRAAEDPIAFLEALPGECDLGITLTVEREPVVDVQ